MRGEESNTASVRPGRGVRPETAEFLQAVDETGDEDYSALVRAAVMFYVLDGWEYRYAFPQMPDWLKQRYWSSDMTRRGLELTSGP